MNKIEHLWGVGGVCSSESSVKSVVDQTQNETFETETGPDSPILRSNPQTFLRLVSFFVNRTARTRTYTTMDYLTQKSNKTERSATCPELAPCAATTYAGRRRDRSVFEMGQKSIQRPGRCPNHQSPITSHQSLFTVSRCGLDAATLSFRVGAFRRKVPQWI